MLFLVTYQKMKNSVNGAKWHTHDQNQILGILFLVTYQLIFRLFNQIITYYLRKYKKNPKKEVNLLYLKDCQFLFLY